MPIADTLSPEEQNQMSQMQAEDAANPMPEEVVQSEPVVETAKEPEPVIEPKQEEKGEKEKRLVPLSELQEERKERRQAQERLEAIMSAMTQRQEPVVEVKEAPNPDQDPLGALKATNAEVQELRKYRETQEQNARQQQIVNNVMQTAIQQEHEYVKDNPDYNDAGNFLRAQRTGQLEALGYTQQQARQQVIKESLDLAGSLLQQGKNVPQAIHEIAKRSGYKVAAPVVTEEARLERVAAGQKANISLSNANGVQQKTGQLDAKAILAMPDDKFTEFLGKLSKTERAAVLGN